MFLRFVTIVLATGLMAYSPLTAQEEDSEEEIATLQEYRVDASREYGYRATSSMTAIRLGGQAVDVPLTINILSSEFIEDLGSRIYPKSIT